MNNLSKISLSNLHNAKNAKEANNLSNLSNIGSNPAPNAKPTPLLPNPFAKRQEKPSEKLLEKTPMMSNQPYEKNVRILLTVIKGLIQA